MSRTLAQPTLVMGSFLPSPFTLFTLWTDRDPRLVLRGAVARIWDISTVIHVISWLSVVGCFVFSRWRNHPFLSSARIFCSIQDNTWLLSISLGSPTWESEFPASRTTFSRLPYFCALFPPYFCPSLCCSRLQANQEDQKPRFNFQDVPKLNILVHFLAFVLAGGGHWFLMKVTTGQFS